MASRPLLSHLQKLRYTIKGVMIARVWTEQGPSEWRLVKPLNPEQQRLVRFSLSASPRALAHASQKYSLPEPAG